MVDFDGTLAGADFRVSSKVRDSISNLLKKNYFFSIASGRPYRGLIENTCKLLSLSAPQIVSGGAEIVDPKTEKLLWHEFIEKGTAKNIINFFLSKNYSFSVESNNYVFDTYFPFKKAYGPGVLFKEIKSLDYGKISKIVLDVIDLATRVNLESELSNKYPNLHIVKSGIIRIYLDITSKKGTKHMAVLKLSEILGIDPDSMIGVGNGYNDYPLLTACGFKIAMENAPDELKEIADLIVPDAANDGLAVAIEKVGFAFTANSPH